MPGPRVVWPSPLLPALIDADNRLTLLVAHHGEARELADWCRQLALLDRRLAQRIALQVLAVEPRRSLALPGFVHGSLAAAPAVRLYEVRLEAGPHSLAPPRSAAVLDLVAGDDVVRRNAVGVLATRGPLRLAFASDIHVARIWNDVGDAVARHAPDLHAGFLHPGQRLDRFVDEINRQAAAGEIDLVVFGGDLVDHVHDVPPGIAADGGNVRLFCDATARLEVPAFAIPGNHDFRLHPWRPRLPNLQSVGLPSSRSPQILRAAGLWDAWPARLSDRHILSTREPDGSSGLSHHLAEVAPATDYALDLRGLRLVFTSTGRDLLPRWRDLEWARRSLVLRTLRTSIEDPDCEGLSDEQIGLIDRAGRHGGGVVLFQHAPLLHSGSSQPFEAHIARLDPGERDDLTARVAFERQLVRAGVRRGVFFRNPAPYLRALLSTRDSTTVLSGHVHRGTAALVDRQTLALRSAPMQAPPNGEDLSIFTAPSLGQQRHREKSQRPGYLLAHFDAGRLAHLEQRALADAARSQP